MSNERSIYRSPENRQRSDSFDAAMSCNESEIMKARRVIFDAAQDMLAARLSYIEGARKIVAAQWAARLDERDADLLPFVGIDSETGEHTGSRRPWKPFSPRSIRRKLGLDGSESPIAAISWRDFRVGQIEIGKY
jgi:hypothetical protein